MSDASNAPQGGSGSQSAGSGGQSFTEGGMMPGGDEMENWQPPQPEEEAEGTIEDQAEGLRKRLEQD